MWRKVAEVRAAAEAALERHRLYSHVAARRSCMSAPRGISAGSSPGGVEVAWKHLEASLRLMLAAFAMS
ncbi:MAG: hypothetical protein ACLSG5_03695 [Oscillospiraceae bacterium]